MVLKFLLHIVILVTLLQDASSYRTRYSFQDPLPYSTTILKFGDGARFSDTVQIEQPFVLGDPATVAAHILVTIAVPEEQKVVMLAADHRSFGKNLSGGIRHDALEATYAKHQCRFSGQEVTVEKVAAEKVYATVQVWSCLIPRGVFTISNAINHCLDFEVINASGVVVASPRACSAHTAGLPADSIMAAREGNETGLHRLAMCIHPIFIHRSFNADGREHPFGMLVQWLEYHQRHGVGHVLVYVSLHGLLQPDDLTRLTDTLELYGDFVTLVQVPEAIAVPQDSEHFMTTDCVWRLRHRAAWVGFFDLDEYAVPLAPDGENSHRQAPFDFLLPDLLDDFEAKERQLNHLNDTTSLNSVTLPMLKFKLPLQGELMVTSCEAESERAKRSYWKQFIRPKNVNVMFTHWGTHVRKGTISLVAENLRYNHYRNSHDLKPAFGPYVRDVSLINETLVLTERLESRMGQPLAAILEGLRGMTPHVTTTV